MVQEPNAIAFVKALLGPSNSPSFLLDKLTCKEEAKQVEELLFFVNVDPQAKLFSEFCLAAL